MGKGEEGKKEDAQTNLGWVAHGKGKEGEYLFYTWRRKRQCGICHTLHRYKVTIAVNVRVCTNRLGRKDFQTNVCLLVRCTPRCLMHRTFAKEGLSGESDGVREGRSNLQHASTMQSAHNPPLTPCVPPPHWT